MKANASSSHNTPFKTTNWIDADAETKVGIKPVSTKKSSKTTPSKLTKPLVMLLAFHAWM
ncbi:MAG: hypothetical protein WEC59_10205 [Salibacteraceae bacterium]